MKKKGQFYLVTVAILVAVFLGVLTLNNSISKTQESPIYDLEKEIQIEKGKTLDYIASNLGVTPIDILVNFSDIYVEKIGSNKNNVFIVGDSSEAYVIGNVDSGNISFSSGSNSGTFEDGYFKQSFVPSGDEVLIDFNGEEFSYDINPGQNIYYIIEHNYNEEVYFIRG